jgi:hypothetical protein
MDTIKRIVTIAFVVLLVSTAQAQTGIGTTTPVNKLQVETSLAEPATTGATANGNLRLSGSTGSHVLDFGLSSAATYAWLQARSKSAYGTNYNLVLNPNGGNVGIGTISPTAKLNLSGGGFRIFNGFANNVARPALNTSTIGNYEIRGVGAGGGSTQSDGADDGFLRLSAGGGNASTAQSSIDISGYSTLPEMNNTIVFRTAGTERLRIDSNGNLSGSTTSTLAGFGAQINTIANSVTLAATDNAEIIQSNAASAITVTIPAGLPTGFNCMVLQYGAGQITFSPAAGVTLINRNSYNKSIGQYALVTLLHIGSNVVIISGELTN